MRAEERRECGVAAVSVDLVGSTSLGETFDVEDVHDVLATLTTAVASAVADRGGELVELAGDGVVATFTGRPEAAARAAVGAAREVLGLLHRAEAGSGPSHVAPPQVRIGIATSATTGTAASDAVVTQATTLEANAPPDTIAACATTRHLADDAGWSAGGSLAVRGRTIVWHRLGATGPAGPRRPRPEVDGRAERRVVTAVFVGPPPDLPTHRLAPALAAAADAMVAEGGTLRRHTGHRVIALFGAPAAREDDPVRAVRAARRAVAAVAPGTGLRAGVTTGLVVVGTTRLAARGDHFDAVGDPMNTAARLQAAAGPGEVLVDDSTWRLVADRFHARPRRTLAVKGKSRPVGVHAVRDTRAVDDLTTAGTGRFVGREPELVQVTDVLAAAGTRRSVAVVAEAGLGKSRLVAEGLRRARGLARLRTIAIRCRPEGAGGADPTRQLVATALGLDPAAQDTDLAAALDALVAEDAVDDHTVDLLRGSVGLPAHDADRMRTWSSATLRQRRSDAMCWLVRRNRAVVVVEDIHWAGEATSDWLRALVSDGAAGLVVTCRPEDRASPVLDLVGSLGRVIELGPLPAPEQRHLLAALAGEGVLPFSLEQRVLEVAAGSPFVLGELVGALVDLGALDLTGTVPVFVGDTDLHLPSSVERLVRTRVDALGTAAREALHAACVVGADVDVDLLAALVPREVDLLAAVAELEEAGILLPAGTGRTYLFSHDLIREVGYATVLRRRRRDLHGAAATALAERADAAPAALVARHWWRAGNHAEAHRWARRGARRARQVLDLELTSDLLDIVVQAERRMAVPDRERLPALLELGEASRLASRSTRALAAFEEAGGLAQQFQDPVALATAALGHEDVTFAARRPRAGVDDPTRRLLDAAAARDLDTATAARIRAALARAQTFEDEPAGGRATAAEAVDLARTSGDPATLAYALIAWRAAHARPTWLRERLDRADEAVDAARRAGDQELVIETMRSRLLDRLEAGVPGALEVDTVEVAEVVARSGQPQYLLYPPMWTVMRSLATGDLDGAAVAIPALFDESRRRGFAGAEAMRTYQQFLLWREQGRAGEVVAQAPQLLARRWQVGDPEPIVAAAAAAVGDLDAAARVLARFMTDVFPTMPDDLGLPGVLAALADASAAVGDRPTVATVYDRLRAFDGHALVVGGGAAHLGAAARTLGDLAAVLGRHERAVHHLEDAIAQDRRSGARLWHGHAAASLAGLLRRQDPARASDLVASAAATAARCGAVRLRQRLHDLEVTTVTGR